MANVYCTAFVHLVSNVRISGLVALVQVMQVILQRPSGALIEPSGALFEPSGALSQVVPCLSLVEPCLST